MPGADATASSRNKSQSDPLILMGDGALQIRNSTMNERAGVLAGADVVVDDDKRRRGCLHPVVRSRPMGDPYFIQPGAYSSLIASRQHLNAIPTILLRQVQRIIHAFQQRLELFRSIQRGNTKADSQ